jgi:fibronectin-binding autotransporter adhesin
LNILGGTVSANAGGTTFIGDQNGTVTGIMNVGPGGTGGNFIGQGVQIAPNAGLGVLNVSSGSFTSTFYLTTGNGGSGTGIINVSGTGVLNAHELTACESSDKESDINQTGGIINVNGPVRIGRSGNNTIVGGDRGVMNLSGGSFNDTDTGDDFQLANNGTNGIGILNISGTAQVNLNIGIFGLNLGTVGGGTAIVTQTGGSLTINPQSNLGLFFGPAQGAQQTFNLAGGTFTVPQITAMGQVDGQTWTGGGLNNGLSIKQTLLLNGGTLVANNTMTVPEISGTHSVTFTAPTAFYTYIGPGGFNINVSSNVVTWNNNLTPVPGATSDGGLTVTGSAAGVMYLAGSNTFTGPINVSSGSLDATQIAALPGYTTSGHITVGPGATLALGVGGTNGFATTDVAAIVTTQTFEPGAYVGIDTTNASGGVTYSSTLTDGPLGSLGLTKLGSNTLYLNGSNTYTGGTKILSGTLSLQSAGALGTTGPITFGNLTPILQYSGSNTTDYSPRFTTAPNQAFGFDTNGQNITFASSLNSPGGSLSKFGPGTLLLQGGSNSFNGFQVHGGTLELSGTITTTGGGNYIYIGNGGSNGGNAGETGMLVLDTGSTLNITGNYGDSIVVGRDGGSGVVIQQPGSTVNFNAAGGVNLIIDASSKTNSTGSYTMNGGTLNMNGNELIVGLLQGAGTMTVNAGNITGVGGLVVGTNGGGETGTFIQNGGTITMNGSSPVVVAAGTGDIASYTITGGTLAAPAILSYGNTFMNNSTLNLNGGTLQATQDSPAFINGFNNAYLMDSGITVDNNSHNITIGQSLTHAGNSSIDGGITFQGTGTTKLLGSNTYTGNTVVTAGKLLVGNPAAIGTGSVILSGGATLALSSNPTSIINLSSFQANGATGFSPTVAPNGLSAQLTQQQTGVQESLLSGSPITISDASGFSASFVYSHSKITAQGGAADGVTFVLVSATGGNSLYGGGGGADGYVGSGGGFDPTANGGANSIAADVDEYNDRIGIGENGNFLGQTAGGSVPISQDTAVKVDVNYTYNTSAGSGTFTETLTSLSNGSTYTYSTAVDLAQLLGGTAGGTASAYFGFTGSTGGVNDNQFVSNLGISNSSGGVPYAGVVVTNPATVADASSATIQLSSTPKYATGGVGMITIGNGSVLNIATNASSGVARGILTTPSVTFTNPSSGQLNIAQNGLDISNQTLASVTAMVASGYAGGTFNGPGIVSTAAANDSSHLTTIGVIQNNATGSPLYTTFDGTPVAAADILVKYTYYGDTNLDGLVDGSDYSRIDNGFLTHLTGWFNGDFNYDGVINGSDYTLIDNAYNTQGASVAAAVATAEVAGAEGSSVPEPTTLGLIGIGATGLLGRRRRR